MAQRGMTIDEAAEIAARLKAGQLTAEDEDATARALELLAAEWRDKLQAVGMRGQLGAPDWMVYELRLFEFGENLRRAKLKRATSTLLPAIARVVQNPAYGKGRQSLVLLLGELAAQAHGPILGSLLRDPDVAGHAVKALTKGRVKGYGREVADLASSKVAWIKQAAKKYLSDVDGV